MSAKGTKKRSKKKSAKKASKPWKTDTLSTSEADDIVVTRQLVAMEKSATNSGASTPAPGQGRDHLSPSGQSEAVTPLTRTPSPRPASRSFPRGRSVTPGSGRPPTVIIIRRPNASPQVLTVASVDSLVRGLAARGRRGDARDFAANAAIRRPEAVRRRCEGFQPNAPNAWRAVTSGELRGIVSRLTKATYSTAVRADAQIYQRKVVERYKQINLAHDIGLTSPSPSPSTPAPPAARNRSPLSFHRQTFLGNRQLPLITK